MNIKFTDEPEDADTGAGAGVTIPGAESLEVPDTAEAEQPLTPGTPSALQLQLESYQELSGASPARLQSRWGQETEKIFSSLKNIWFAKKYFPSVGGAAWPSERR